MLAFSRDDNFFGRIVYNCCMIGIVRISATVLENSQNSIEGNRRNLVQHSKAVVNALPGSNCLADRALMLGPYACQPAGAGKEAKACN